MCVTAPINSGFGPSAVTSITPSTMVEGTRRGLHRPSQLQQEPSPWGIASTYGQLTWHLGRSSATVSAASPPHRASTISSVRGHVRLMFGICAWRVLNYQGPCQHTEPSHDDEAAWQKSCPDCRERRHVHCKPSNVMQHPQPAWQHQEAQLPPSMCLYLKHQADRPVRRPLRAICRQLRRLSCLHGQTWQ